MNKANNFAKNKRRKRILFQNTIFVLAAYALTQVITLIAKFLNLSSVTYFQIFLITSSTFSVTIMFLILIYLKKVITNRFTVLMHFGQFVVWLAAYSGWIYTLHEVRSMGLFFALMCIAFLLSDANFIQSLTITIAATIIQVSVSYFAITKMNQTGSISNEIFYAFCFLPAALFISYLASVFKKQKNEIKKAKKIVEERNLEIEDANKRMAEMNEDLKKTTQALWGEMELAKKIQTVLLPENPKIKGYEISAIMNPADEVGGDYYDIINVEGMDWIIIGDVSGHGVSAGLVMMMVMTSIHSVLKANPLLKPAELLARVNSVIAENIKRLNEDKYMTITVIACMKDGVMNFSGLHQDIMIYKEKKKDVVLLETHGMWIGLFDEIEELLEEESLTMDKGDAMLVYTDGVTEAWRKGSVKDERRPDEDMFGDEKLKELFKQVGPEEPCVVTKTILEELKNYDCPDDVTLVAIKRVG